MGYSVFASTRSVQIATKRLYKVLMRMNLCLHTPRADCNTTFRARSAKGGLCLHTPRADCNKPPCPPRGPLPCLCLHTPRADCNDAVRRKRLGIHLCLHTPRADCNIFAIRQSAKKLLCLHTPRADCNHTEKGGAIILVLCLHTPRADCNGIDKIKRLSPKNFASTRPVQIATAEMHRIAICTFQNVC